VFLGLSISSETMYVLPLQSTGSIYVHSVAESKREYQV